MSKTDPLELLVKKLSDEASPDELKQLDEILKDDAVLRMEFESLEKAWRVSGQMKPVVSNHASTDWEKIISRNTGNSTKEGRKFSLFPHTYLRLAASLAVLAITAWFIIWYTFPVSTFSVTTNGGQREMYELPDGSKVWLNQNSTLAYSESRFSPERNVQFEGEGYFEIIHNPEKPFQIHTEHTVTTVLGTRFNLFAYGDNSKVELFLIEGKVSFSRTNTDEELILEPGQSAVLHKLNNDFDKIESSLENKLAWKERRLVFFNTPLSTVVTTVSRYFKVELEIENEGIESCLFTSTFDDPSLEEVLDVLSATMDLEIITNNNKYLIKGTNCK